MSNRITHGSFFGRRFGYDENGVVDLPTRYSSRKLAGALAVHNGDHGCDICFPCKCGESFRKTSDHRSWKRYRKNQYRASGRDLSAPQSGLRCRQQEEER